MTFDEYPLHDSIRGWFGRALYFEMQKDDRVWCLTSDLGFGLLDHVKEDFPDRFLNVGASECCMIGAGVGLALSGKIPFCYSITTFLLFRSFEWVRNYLNHEQIPVRLIGSGLGNDYAHDGISHQPSEAELRYYFENFKHIKTFIPEDKESVPTALKMIIETNAPSFMCLRR